MSTSIRVKSISKVTVTAVDSGTHVVRIKATGPAGTGIGDHESTYNHPSYDAHVAATSGIHGLTGAPAEATDVAANTVNIAQNASDIVSLQNQDAVLEGELDAHVADTSNPHSVTAAQVGLGTADDVEFNSITTDLIEFDKTAAEAVTSGQLAWNEDEDTLDLGVNTNVTLQLGQETVYNVRNNSGATIADGSPVMATGTIGASGRITVGLMDATDTTNSKYFLGLATETLANDADGKVTHFGKIRGIDTTGGLSFGGAETWNDGDVLYLDPDNVGYLTNVVPSNSDVEMPIAFIIKAHLNGTLFCRASSIDENAFVPRTQQADTKDPTGWADNTAISSTYDSTTRTITLTGDLRYYWQGVLHELTSPWTSDPHPATLDDTYFLYSTDGTTFAWNTVVWEFDQLMAGFVNYGTSNKYGVVETHGLMPWQAHKEFHSRQGTYKEAGGTLSGYTLASTTAANRRPTVSATVLNDEDIETTLPEWDVDILGATQYTLSGATPTTVFNIGATDIVPLSGNRPYWNENSGGTWQQTLMSNNNYMSVWLVGVPVMGDTGSQTYRYWWVQGQSEGDLASEQALSPLDLLLTGVPAITPEFTFLAKVILRYTAGNWQLTQVDILSGTRSQITSGAAGNYLSIVSHDTTLTGAGTSGSPLGVLDDMHNHIASNIDDFDTEVSNNTDVAANTAARVTNGNSHDHSGGDGAQINHTTLSNIGTNTHAQVDTHIADATKHFTEASIDHANIQNVGTTSHADIDTHVGSTSNPHSVTKTQVGLGNVANILDKLDGTTAPTANDDSGDGYSVGSRWVDVTNDVIYFCLDATLTAAVWQEVGAGGSVTWSDSSFPGSPTTGQLFTLNVTGRKVLLEYDGSNWIPVQSFGAMTMYVDGTNGTDSMTKGTGTGTAAFATIQYAVDQIPAVYSGDVNINVAAGTYAENVVVRGKAASGDYNLYINGALTTLETVTSATCTSGTSGNHGTVTKTGAFTGDSYAKKLCYFVTDDQYRVIRSHTNDTLTLVGQIPSATTQNVLIMDWGTIVDPTSGEPFYLYSDCYLQGLDCQGTSRVTVTKASATIYYCSLDEGVYSFNLAVTLARYNLVETTRSYAFDAINLTSQTIHYNYFVYTGSGVLCRWISNCSGGTRGNYISGSGSGTALIIQEGSMVSFWSSDTTFGDTILYNWSVGVDVDTGAGAANASSGFLQYSSVTTSYTEDSANYAFYQ